jgi:hypothetical protein
MFSRKILKHLIFWNGGGTFVEHEFKRKEQTETIGHREKNDQKPLRPLLIHMICIGIV